MYKIHSLFELFFRFFRPRRIRRFILEFGVKQGSSVLDVGGTAFTWRLLPKHPALTLLNVCSPPDRDGVFSSVVGDGRHLPFKSYSYNIVFSNSVIEHLGSIENQRAFASECRRVGKKYYIQTPNRKFFMEPHFITPFVHWFPQPIQRKLVRNFTIWGLITRPDATECDAFLKEIRLLDEVEMQELFPDAKILHERFLGMSKSLIAVKSK